MAALLKELDGLIGLHQVKTQVRGLFDFVNANQRCKEGGFAVTPLALRLVFEGNPGTGKTTVARLIGKLYGGCWRSC